jgi:hypothetical protein
MYGRSLQGLRFQDALNAAHRVSSRQRRKVRTACPEVWTWKKLIRVLSHEVDNSLGPLSSLAHSGAEIARRGRLLHVVAAALEPRGDR